MDSQLSSPLERAIDRISCEVTISTLLQATTRELVELLEASRCAISRAIGDLLVEVAAYQPIGSKPQHDLYLASDFPLTKEVLEQGEARTVSLADPDADAAEADLLRRLGHTELLMLPLDSRGTRWGLVEVYASERPFAQPDLEVGQALLSATEALLGRLEPGSGGSTLG